MDSFAGLSPGILSTRRVVARVYRFGVWLLTLGCFVSGERFAIYQADGTVSETIRRHEYDLSAQGRAFLLKRSWTRLFFLLGELHGENEIPTLLRTI